jgi:FkbM family methyltransferase
MSAINYYSQDGQDKYLDEKVFKKKRGGFFIEIGANDGIKFSNTYFLEKNRGWNGICVEPHPTAFEKLQKNRTATLINACIADSEKEGEFMRIDGYGEMYSGLVSKYDEKHVKRIERDLAAYGGSKETIKIPCMTLDSIIKNSKVSHVDYCSIDTEGGELDILKTANLKENEITVISVENNYYGKSLKDFMKNFDYWMIGKVGADEFYSKKKPLFWFLDWK